MWACTGNVEISASLFLSVLVFCIKSNKTTVWNNDPRYIRDQSLMLSEITPNFGRFLPSQILGGEHSERYAQIWI